MESLDKSALILLALELDIKDVLSLCNTNSEINNKISKNSNFWIAKLKRDFSFEFLDKTTKAIIGGNPKYSIYIIPRANERDPRKFYYFLASRFNDSWKLSRVVKYNHLDLVKYLLSRAQSIGSAVSAAARNNDREMIDLLISSTEYRDEYYITLAGAGGAAKGGHIDLLKYFVEKGIDHLELLGEACHAGENAMLIINYLISRGAHSWSDGLAGAAYAGRMDLVKFFMDRKEHRWGRKAHNWEGAMAMAAQGGGPNSLKIVKYMVLQGASDWDNALDQIMYYSKGGTHTNKLIKFFVDRGADIDRGIAAALESGEDRDERIEYIKIFKTRKG